MLFQGSRSLALVGDLPAPISEGLALTVWEFLWRGRTLPIGDVGIVFIGVYNEGRIEDRDQKAAESLLNKVSGELSNIYPPIYPQLLVRERDGKYFIAAMIEGSEERPHFAGKAWVRNGSKSEDASKEEFEELIDRRK